MFFQILVEATPGNIWSTLFIWCMKWRKVQKVTGIHGWCKCQMWFFLLCGIMKNLNNYKTNSSSIWYSYKGWSCRMLGLSLNLYWWRIVIYFLMDFVIKICFSVFLQRCVLEHLDKLWVVQLWYRWLIILIIVVPILYMRWFVFQCMLKVLKTKIITEKASSWVTIHKFIKKKTTPFKDKMLRKM